MFRDYFNIDIGLRNAVSFRFSKDIGRCAENVLYIHLISQGNEVFYWKNKHECDFIVFHNDKVVNAINICMDMNDDKIRKREINGLLEAMKNFKLHNGIIITEDHLDTEKHEGLTVEFIPLWLYLLKNSLLM